MLEVPALMARSNIAKNKIAGTIRALGFMGGHFRIRFVLLLFRGVSFFKRWVSGE